MTYHQEEHLHFKYNEIQSQDNQMMILEIVCQKVVKEIGVLLESIDIYKYSLAYLKEYEEKKDLLYKLTHLGGFESEGLIHHLRTLMVNEIDFEKVKFFNRE